MNCFWQQENTEASRSTIHHGTCSRLGYTVYRVADSVFLARELAFIRNLSQTCEKRVREYRKSVTAGQTTCQPRI